MMLQALLIKSEPHFLDGSQTLNEAVHRYSATASKNFCSIEFFNSLISGGTAIKVELLSEDNSTLKEFTVDKCGK